MMSKRTSDRPAARRSLLRDENLEGKSSWGAFPGCGSTSTTSSCRWAQDPDVTSHSMSAVVGDSCKAPSASSQEYLCNQRSTRG